jgi:hypothetical protein
MRSSLKSTKRATRSFAIEPIGRSSSTGGTTKIACCPVMSVRGVWGNIHILLVPEASKFRFSYAVWYDEDLGIDQGYRVSLRSWSTSDDDASGDRYLSLDEATVTSVKRCLDETWAGLLRLSMQPMVHADRIRVGVTAADLPRSEPVMPRSVRGLVGKAPIWASRRNGQLSPHSPDNALSFGAACAIQI